MLDSGQAWSAQHNNHDQWMVIDAGSSTTVRGIIVMGRGHSAQNQKVTRVRVHVSEDRNGPWSDCGEHDCHPGGGEHSKKRVTLPNPAVGRYVKLNPRSWEHHISMRVGLILGVAESNGKAAMVKEMLVPLVKRLEQLVQLIAEKELESAKAEIDKALAVAFDRSMSLEGLGAVHRQIKPVLDRLNKEAKAGAAALGEIEVVRAGKRDCNGFYKPDGEWRGHKRWKHVSKNVWLRRGGDGWEWRWYLVNCRERANPNPNYYKADGHDNRLPPTHGWSDDGGGGESPQLVFHEPNLLGAMKTKTLRELLKPLTQRVAKLDELMFSIEFAAAAREIELAKKVHYSKEMSLPALVGVRDAKIQPILDKHAHPGGPPEDANPPESARSYSTVHGGNAIGTGHARSMLDSGQAWSAQHNNHDQWMVIDAGSSTTVRGIIVMGRGHSAQNQKVTRVRVHVSEDRNGPWSDCGEHDCHPGGGEHSKKRVTLPNPAVGRYVKLNPRSWEHHISMRVGLILAKDVIKPQMKKALEPLKKHLAALAGLIEEKRCYDPIPLIPASLPEVHPQIVAAIVTPQDLPQELQLLAVLRGEPPRRVECPCCAGLGTAGSGSDGVDALMPPMVGRQKSGQRSWQRTALTAAWAFEGAARDGSWTCFDAKMSRQLEEAYRDGPGAVVHVTSNDRTFEYVVDLSSMMQVCASF